MSTLEHLTGLVADRTAQIGVIGLGYVGLPVAATFAEAGFSVIGIDLDPSRVAIINAGRSPIEGAEPGLDDLIARTVGSKHLRASTDHSLLATADIVTINVQTPVTEDHRPDYRALESALRSLGKVLASGTLVIVESTVSPGTTLGLVRPMLEEVSRLVEGRDFFVGACPERVMPGRLLSNIRNVARVCGGSTAAVSETMRALYRTVVDADIDCATPTSAELVKVLENTYRDVQIAFANEAAMICAELGEDVWRVRELVNKVPERQMHRPGGGVGGHCIPKDPWLLASAVSDQLRLIPAARAVNDGMPFEIARLARRASDLLAGSGDVDPEVAGRILVLGYSYLPESDDTRNSPSETLVTELRRLGLTPVVHDPFVPGLQDDPILLAKTCGVAVTMVCHLAYADLVLPVPVAIDAGRLADARRLLDSLQEAGRV